MAKVVREGLNSLSSSYIVQFFMFMGGVRETIEYSICLDGFYVVKA
jgi:hypothetical protein